MSSHDGSTGRTWFVGRHGLGGEERSALAAEVEKRIKAEGLEVVRLAFADQHGILRGKTLVADATGSALRNGVAMVSTLLLKDTAHRTVYPVWQPGAGIGMAALEGAGDFLMVPDPATFRVLPWAEATGWMLCDLYFPDGRPVPFSTRQMLRDALALVEDRGWRYVTGLEVEFHVFHLEDGRLAPEDAGQPAAPPQVSLVAHGFQYLTESRMDEIDPIMTLLRREMAGLGLPLRSFEVEYGPSQFEITFDPAGGLESADNMIVFRSAVKQICRRHGLHATFMCRPGLANIFSSGWHLHQSLVDGDGANIFMPEDEAAVLSPVGLNFVAGLLEHAREGAIFSTPTINGYKRYRPNSLAPDRIVWGRDNKGAMIRALGGAHDRGSRIENRAGEPAANPYLYLAAQIHAGLDGIDRKLDPGAPADSPYAAEAALLPRSLMEAVAAFRASAFWRERLGDEVVDWLVTLKEAEIARFLSEVTDWEHREYFEMF
jgi:glutamine synthetase